MPKLTAKDKRYRRWVSSHPCYACGIEDDTISPHHLTFLRRGGMKAEEKHQVPLCNLCHNGKLHLKGEKTFWANLGKSLEEVKEYAESLFNSYKDKP
jgi:hypothetical protein